MSFVQWTQDQSFLFIIHPNNQVPPPPKPTSPEPAQPLETPPEITSSSKGIQSIFDCPEFDFTQSIKEASLLLSLRKRWEDSDDAMEKIFEEETVADKDETTTSEQTNIDMPMAVQSQEVSALLSYFLCSNIIYSHYFVLFQT